MSSGLAQSAEHGALNAAVSRSNRAPNRAGDGPAGRNGVVILPGKIISGGQTGVDRAALDFAIERGIAWGGWAPKGWRSEDGTIPERYREHMRETISPDYEQRTEWNVIGSTATLVLYDGRVMLSPGTRKTMGLARFVAEQRRGREQSRWTRYDDVNLHPDAFPVLALRRWVNECEPDLRVLNIAGPRESKAPGIYAATLALLREVWP